MNNIEQFVSYEGGRFVLPAAGSQVPQVLGQGDRLEVFEYGRFQSVTVCSGGYGGWYYLTAGGRSARFAIGLRARNYRAICVNI
jgi:hypothetical protein